MNVTGIEGWSDGIAVSNADDRVPIRRPLEAAAGDSSTATDVDEL